MSDVLLQVALSATEESLRTQTYSGVCNGEGVKMNETDRLEEHCGKLPGGEVVIALPRGITEKECVKLANPILSDPKVMAMVSSSLLPDFCLHGRLCPRPQITPFALRSISIEIRLWSVVMVFSKRRAGTVLMPGPIETVQSAFNFFCLQG